MFTRLMAKNFRAFKELDIPCAKINLFFGPNNSGKSAAMSIISLLAQTIRSPDRDVPLLLNGVFEDLGTYEDVVYLNDVAQDITLGMEFTAIGSPDESPPGPIDRTIEATFHYRRPRHQIVLDKLRLSDRATGVVLETRVAKVSKSQIIVDVGSDYVDDVTRGPASSGHIILDHFLPEVNRSARLMFPRKRTGRRGMSYREFGFQLYEFGTILREQLDGVEFIGPFRRNPERIYPFSGETPSSVGVHGENTVGVLVSNDFLPRRQQKSLISNISKWFQKSGIARELLIFPFSERNFEIRLRHVDTGEEENIVDVGYGCSQILPILVAGYQLDAGRTLAIAQPEIHLHPKAEAEIGTFLCDVASRDIQVFAETHGVHLMLRLQSHVAAGDLSPDDVNVFCIYSDKRTKKKMCRRIPMGPDGFFQEEWPRGFFTERLDEAKRLAKFSV